MKYTLALECKNRPGASARAIQSSYGRQLPVFLDSQT